MQQWDYAVVLYWDGNQELAAGWVAIGGEAIPTQGSGIEALRAMGERGWELCAVTTPNANAHNDRFYFKRQIPN